LFTISLRWEAIGSKCIHNTRYAVEVLQATIEAVSGNPIPGAARP